MSNHLIVRRLRPYLFSRFERSQPLRPSCAFSSHPSPKPDQKQRNVTNDYEKRVAQLEAHRPLSDCYPRLHKLSSDVGTENTIVVSSQGSVRHGHVRKGVSKKDLKRDHGQLQPGETATHGAQLSYRGRIHSLRTAGSKLFFVDVLTQHERETVQIVGELSNLQQIDENLTSKHFGSFCKIARKGDVYSFTGYPHRTARGELSILITELPTLLSPALRQIPDNLDDSEARARARHLDMLVNPDAIRTLRVRHGVERALQDFFNSKQFIKVTTPILSLGSGGASARAFETEATELAGEKLSLRIAPELWLKRLVIGGMDAVYEIGPSFRNEGVDATHNPEFNICEAYHTYWTLKELMNMTQDLLQHLVDYNRQLAAHGGKLGTSLSFDDAFDEVEFVPGLERKLGCRLPDLQSPDAYPLVHALFEKHGVAIPSNPTLARLLDALAAHYLEPMSNDDNPLFITHHPACLSPLSKHFTCAETGQVVAARAELFINGREYANMYEEENSPFEQRRKFEEQLVQRKTDAEAMELDESYLQAMEWGMPPTGGWGCGVDRLVMLLSGRERMADVLAFGSLRNVVGLRSGEKR